MQRKKLTLVIVSLLVVVLSVSLAYFTTQIIGKGKDVSVSSVNLQIIFNDTGGEISASEIEPGWSMSKEFTIKNSSNGTYKYDIVIKDLINTFSLNYLKYKITSTTGYNMTDYADVPKSATAVDTVLASGISIDKGVTQTYTIEFTYLNDESVDQSADMAKKLSGTVYITKSAPTLYTKLLEDNPTIGTRDTFNTVFTDNTTGTLFTATERNVHNTTGTTVYYYAGNTTNNWIKFGDFYWRIIRTNADGGVRLLYHGTSPDSSEAFIGSSSFNLIYTETMYVGYMYGTTGTLVSNRTNTNSSEMKKYLENWYANNLTTYNNYLSTTAVYCNDRNIASGYSYDLTTTFYYAPYYRANISNEPTYDCTEKADAFSVDNASAKLTYPIGLMTSDEITYAGGKINSNLSKPYAWYYLNSVGSSSTGSTDWRLMSPYHSEYISSSRVNIARVFYVHGNLVPGNFTGATVDNPYAVRPVVSLKSCVKYSSGDGSASDPYTIKETTSGC